MTLGPEEDAYALQGSWSRKGVDFQAGTAVSVKFCILKASFCLGPLCLSSLACLTSPDSEGQPHFPSLPSGERFCSSSFSPALGKTQGTPLGCCMGTCQLQAVFSPKALSSPHSIIPGGEQECWRQSFAGLFLLKPRKRVLGKPKHQGEPAPQLESQLTASINHPKHEGRSLRRFHFQPLSYRG